MKLKESGCNASIFFNSPTLALRKKIAEAAEQEAAHFPNDFRGETAYVFYKFNYVYPYDNLDGIRRYILTVKSNTGLRNKYKGYVAIDLSEWEEHINEEYFQIFIMFLADHSDGIHYLLFFGTRDTDRQNEIQETIQKYMSISIMELSKDTSTYVNSSSYTYKEDY